MQFSAFSPKQSLAMNWWMQPKHRKKDAIICDGAIRSGKTLSMSIGFVSWAMTNFSGHDFALCGKTVTALKRNVMNPLLAALGSLGFICLEKVSRNFVEITLSGQTNRFYLFGGKDEASASLIQGITLSGVMLDEVALMPRSFVEQALARCSVTGSKLWFNCNPDHPGHWFYREWIKKLEQKNALYLHFTMRDNRSLSKEIRERYERLYAGVFYDRFILGKWIASSGLIYPMFQTDTHVVDTLPHCTRYVISADYGTVNPASFGLWGQSGTQWVRLAEYYFDARREGYSKTDEEHYEGLCALAGDLEIDCVTIDPSAASFITCIQRHERFRVVPAKNEVLAGIQRVSEALKQHQLLFHKSCRDCLREFSLYCWSERSGGDTPIKEHDHAMDDVRYFVNTILQGANADPFFVASLQRR